MERPAEDTFCIFISHKHEDHGWPWRYAARCSGSATDSIECFVSGVDISAGADWNRQIKVARSRRAICSSCCSRRRRKNWDWCLYEAGLFTRFDVEDVSAIVCLFNPETGSPRPLANLQGVAAQTAAVEKFLGELCRETWCISDDWRRGPLDADVDDGRVSSAANEIVAAFPRHRSRNGRTTRATASSSTSPPSTRSERSSRSRRGSSKATARRRASRSRCSTGPTVGAR